MSLPPWVRWLAMLLLCSACLQGALTTLLDFPADLLANRFRDAPPPDRLMLANAFFEHWGLVGGFLLVAWHDMEERLER